MDPFSELYLPIDPFWACVLVLVGFLVGAFLVARTYARIVGVLIPAGIRERLATRVVREPGDRADFEVTTMPLVLLTLRLLVCAFRRSHG